MPPPATTPAPYRDIWVRSADGLRLHARGYGDPAAPAVIGLPGLARHAADFHDLAIALTGPDASTARHVVAVDYRGRGLSDRDPDPAHYNPQTETADLLRLVDELGIRQAVLVGTSRGGILAMLAAAGRPGLVRGAVLNDIGPVIERAGLLRIKGYVGRLGPPRTFAPIQAGVPDGLKVDGAGRVYAACGDGIRIFAPDGTPLGRIATPTPAANLAFGGSDGRRLFVAAGHAILAIDLRVAPRG